MDYFSKPQTSAQAQQPDDSVATPGPATATEAFPRTPLTPFTTAPVIPPSQVLRIRRLPSQQTLGHLADSINANANGVVEEERTGRRRSSSQPLRPAQSALPAIELQRQATAPGLPAVTEERSHQDGEEPAEPEHLRSPPPPAGGRLRAASNAALSHIPGTAARSRSRANSNAQSSTTAAQHEYDSKVVDLLDVVDPEVSTLTTLNNVQNSLFIPYLGKYFNRAPTYDLSRYNSGAGPAELWPQKTNVEGKKEDDVIDEIAEVGEELEQEELEKQETIREEAGGEEGADKSQLKQLNTISSTLSESRYAVLPHGTVLDGWTDEDKAELNDHVRHLMHSRKAKFRRTMKAFGKFVRKPVGFLITLYAFLLTFWGAAWVLFLIGWIYTGSSDRQAYFVEICDQILTALFTVVGIGLSPFRAVDTYHMIYIAHYHYLTWKLRKERGLPELVDPNELPEPEQGNDLELAREKTLETVVLSEEQQKKLLHHQRKFCRSHTFYKPHETFTHYAFSVKLLITIVVLLDCHSLFQMALGGTTWGIYYKVRPKALTAVILSCSISCNISAGITISVGDRRSRKKRVVEQLFRQALTEEALQLMKNERGLEASRENTNEPKQHPWHDLGRKAIHKVTPHHHQEKPAPPPSKEIYHQESVPSQKDKLAIDGAKQARDADEQEAKRVDTESSARSFSTAGSGQEIDLQQSETVHETPSQS